MGPILRFSSYFDAINAFNKLIKNDSKLLAGPKPIDVDEIENVQYLIQENDWNTIQCYYELGDRHYNRQEIILMMPESIA